MPRLLVIQPLADADIVERYMYLAQHAGLAVAERFLSAIQSAAGELLLAPLAGSSARFENTGLAGMRIWRITGFESVLIFYLPDSDKITIVRVLHGAQDIETILDTSTE